LRSHEHHLTLSELFFGDMKARGKIHLTLYVLGFAGAALFTVLLIRQGVSAVGAAIAAAGWWIAAVAAFHLLPIFLDAVAWHVLFPTAERPRLPSLFWMRWIGESISNLVPSAMVGGDLVRARLSTITGTPMATAVASVIVDVTLGVPMQIIFTLAGLTILVQASGARSLVGPTVLGALIGIAAIAGFFLVQRLGMFRFLAAMITRLAKSKEWSSLVQSGETVDATLHNLYSRRSGVIGCCGWTVVSLVVSSGEIWIALHALGAQATFVNAFILQSMAMTVRSAAFAVPGQLGVQESGYLVLGNLLGIPSQTAFAISLIARFRDLIIGVPALVTWQVIEGRRLLRARSPAASR
jgi:putative membrane protein